MDKKNTVKNLKIAALTSATVCIIATSLIGCGIKNDNSTFSNSKENIVEETIIQENDKEYTTDESYDLSQSYNSYLYNNGDISLNTPITADHFGFAMSKRNNNADRRLEEGEYNPLNITINEEDYGDYVTWVNSEDVVYLYSDLYDIDYSIQEAEKYEDKVEEQTKQHTDLITDINTIPSADLIENKILSNNTNYLNNNKQYTKLDESYIRLISELLVTTLENYYNELSQEELVKIYCMLNDIKVVGINSTDFTINDLKIVYNARVTEDGIVFLDVNEIEKLNGKDTLKRTVSHEIIHLFQRMCPDHQIEGYTQIGSSQYFDSFDSIAHPNSLHFQWLYEATAEQMSMKINNAKTPLVYKNMVGYLNTLDLITLIRPDYKENSIALSQISNNPEEIYKVLGAETKEEKKELAEMLYSICYIQDEREDFEQAYEKEYGEIDGKETTIKREMKQSVIKTMTKYFYKNLAERIAHSEVTMQDTFYLMNVFESAINVHLIYDDLERYDLNKEAIEYYIECQDKLFNILAENNNYTFNDIVEMYAEYALVIKTNNGYERNCSLSWLSNNEKQYLADVLTTNIGSLSINIRDLEIPKNEYKK